MPSLSKKSIPMPNKLDVQKKLSNKVSARLQMGKGNLASARSKIQSALKSDRKNASNSGAYGSK